jgi:hypothetical protein
MFLFVRIGFSIVYSRNKEKQATSTKRQKETKRKVKTQQLPDRQPEKHR